MQKKKDDDIIRLGYDPALGKCVSGTITIRGNEVIAINPTERHIPSHRAIIMDDLSEDDDLDRLGRNLDEVIKKHEDPNEDHFKKLLSDPEKTFKVSTDCKVDMSSHHVVTNKKIDVTLLFSSLPCETHSNPASIDRMMRQKMWEESQKDSKEG